MKAMILAAGRGERMRPLTDTAPKPLLKMRGRPIIEWTIERLARGGIIELVINHSHLASLIEAALGDGARLGAPGAAVSTTSGTTRRTSRSLCRSCAPTRRGTATASPSRRRSFARR